MRKKFRSAPLPLHSSRSGFLEKAASFEGRVSKWPANRAFLSNVLREAEQVKNTIKPLFPLLPLFLCVSKILGLFFTASESLRHNHSWKPNPLSSSTLARNTHSSLRAASAN